MGEGSAKRLYLIGGAAGAGKTTVARQLARELGAGWLQADTIWRALQPALGESVLDVDEAIRSGARSADEIVEQHIEAATLVCRALEAAIAFELRTTHDALVVDGAWLHPEWMRHLNFAREEPDGQVRQLASFDSGVPVEIRPVVLFEQSADEVKSAMRLRWATASGQVRDTLPRERLGAHVSWLYGNWLADQAQQLGYPWCVRGHAKRWSGACATRCWFSPPA